MLENIWFLNGVASAIIIVGTIVINVLFKRALRKSETDSQNYLDSQLSFKRPLDRGTNSK